MRLGHMLVHRDMPAALRCPHMAGDPHMIVEDFYHPVRQPNIHLPADQPMRYRVEGLIRLDMIIRVNAGRFPLGIFEH